MAGAMQELKAFLEVDPHLPSDSLPLTNWKHKRGDEHAVRAAGKSLPGLGRKAAHRGAAGQLGRSKGPASQAAAHPPVLAQASP